MTLSYLQLVEALRTENTTEINKLNELIASSTSTEPSHYGSPLHLAVFLSSPKIINQIIQFMMQSSLKPKYLTWINCINSPLGETPLHVASKLGRIEVIEILFRFPNIDDTIRNHEGLCAIDTSKTLDTKQILQSHQAEYTLQILKYIRQCVLDKSFKNIQTYFEMNPRSLTYLKNGWFDINAPINVESEEGLLHFGAKWDDLEMVEWALFVGADPNVKDKRGRLPIDYCVKKDSKVKEKFKMLYPVMASNLVTQEQEFGLLGSLPPFYQGKLLKWTNFATGYKSRYFALENGIFSYFKSQDDYPLSCRGAISMRIANVHLPDLEVFDYYWFDIIGKGSVKYSLKARTPTDAKKWIWCLMQSKQWMMDQKELPLPLENPLESPQSVHSKLLEKNHPSKEQTNPTDLNNDIDSLNHILKIHLDAQSQAISSIIGIFNKQSISIDGSNEIIQLLNQSSISIIDLCMRIHYLYTFKEKEWGKKLQVQVESSKRWEEIVNKVLGDERIINDINDIKISHDSNDNQYVSDDDEVFYDANNSESQDNNNTGFIEKVLGFSDNDSFERLQSPQTFTSFSNLDTCFPKLKDIVLLSNDHPKPCRVVIPFDPSKPKPPLNVWSFIKSAIGKDLRMLQRMSEDMEYVSLLNLASYLGKSQTPNPNPTSIPNPTQPPFPSNWNIPSCDLDNLNPNIISELRHLMVSAFAMSNYSSTSDRTSKPFNPVLGETFELVDECNQYRYISEQVCHHPPISACYCDSPQFIFWSEVNVKSKFWGKSLELHPLGNCHVKLSLNKGETEHFSWKKVSTTVNNLILGKLEIDHHGDMVIKSWKTKYECTITFKPKPNNGLFGFFSTKKEKIAVPDGPDNESNEIIGHLKDNNGIILWEIWGGWTTQLCARRINSSNLPPTLQSPIILWKRNSLPINSSQLFNFTQFAMKLNEINDTLIGVLPLSDSRLRPDQRFMEVGNWDDANLSKEKIEKIQRSRRTRLVNEFNLTGIPSGPIRPNEQKGIPMGEPWWSSRWFILETDADTSEEHWTFTNEYWKARSSRQWENWVLDLFNE